MKILIKRQTGLSVPQKAHSNDSCFDLLASEEPTIYGERANFPLYNEYTSFGQLYNSIQFLEYRTNVFIAPQDDKKKKYCTFLYPRSSLSNMNLAWAASIGVIDNQYRGELLVRFKYVIQPEDLCVVPISGITQIYTKINQEKIYHKEQKIAQLFVSELIDASFELVDNLNSTTRAEGGFGSSGQ